MVATLVGTLVPFDTKLADRIFGLSYIPELLDEVCFRGSEADEAAEVEVR